MPFSYKGKTAFSKSNVQYTKVTTIIKNKFNIYQILATPVSIAAFLTASATVLPILLSKASGRM